ncbi:MAG: glycoside hydrolase family 2 TIM barrel-domain containing protein [bacterium]
MKKLFIHFLYFFTVLSLPGLAQIKIKEAPVSNFSKMDSIFIDSNAKRKIIPLIENWRVYPADDSENKYKVSVPSTFEGTESLVYERNLDIRDNDIVNYNIFLEFLGLNYSAEILINNLSIYKHSGSTVPFSVEIPKDILNFGEPNKLAVKVTYAPDAESTIPIKPQFLFPLNSGGLTREVYLKLVPKTYIANFHQSYFVSENHSSARLNLDISLQKNKYPDKNETEATAQSAYQMNIIVKSKNNVVVSALNNIAVAFTNKNTSYPNLQIDIASPILWSPANPHYYIMEVQLLENNLIIDETSKYLSIYKLDQTEEGYTLNGASFRFNGTTYLFSNPKYGPLIPLAQLEKDLQTIKQTGFNAIRFAKEIPHPFALRLCEKLGLLAFIELPLNSIPGAILQNPNFRTRTLNYLRSFTKEFENYSAVVAIGLGSSYLSNSDVHLNFIKDILAQIKNNEKLKYASFIGLPHEPIEGLDLYGYELYANDVVDYFSKFESAIENIGISKVFISEATYPTFNGSTSGYLNKFSFEAQAKYFSDLIDFVADKKLQGFFINSIFDFRGNIPSFFSSYNEDNIYLLGLLGERHKGTRLAQKVINAKLTSSEKPTIPIGNKMDDSPVLFILLGVVLSVIVTLLINSKRKFREDASRALLRPYNFYADIRDHRILSGFHTIVLMLVLSGTHALLVTNLLFFLRTNILLEKILIALGSSNLIKFIAILAWDPVKSLLYIFIISIISFTLVALLIKAASFFIKTRVLFSSIFYTVIWSFLPLAILLPLELVLYRILLIDTFNFYIYIFLVIYLLWVFQRIIKGIYVIFDIHPLKVYFYTFLFVLITVGGTLFYLQLSNSSIDLIYLAFEQFQLI